MGANDGGVFESEVPVSMYEQWQNQQVINQQLQQTSSIGDINSTKPIDMSQLSGSAGREIHDPSLRQFVNGNQDAEEVVQEFVDAPAIDEYDLRQMKDVEDLIFLGRIAKEIIFHGHKIQLKTLNGLDNLNVVSEVSHLEPATRLAASVYGVLSRAIKTMDGKKFFAEEESEISYSKFASADEAKAWLLQWQQPLVDELYAIFADLVEDQTNKISATIKK